MGVRSFASTWITELGYQKQNRRLVKQGTVYPDNQTTTKLLRETKIRTTARPVFSVERSRKVNG